jgi:pyrroline-5-carboxylate reductase
MKIGFIGGGNMAQALMGGLVAERVDAQFIVVEPVEPVRDTLVRMIPGAVVQDTPSAELGSCDAVVFAVKPQMFREAATMTARWLDGSSEQGSRGHDSFVQGPAVPGPAVRRPLVISIAAGIRVREIAHWLGCDHAMRPIVRAMPNTPALIGAGITGLYAVPEVDGHERELAETLLAAVGQTLWVDDEAKLDIVTAVSGSGPAYVFSFIEALEQGAIDLGLSPEDARRLALATFVGASRLASESAEPVAVLRERVTSKGGTTFAALTHLQEARCSEAIVEAVHKAALRSAQMGDEFGRDA